MASITDHDERSGTRNRKLKLEFAWLRIEMTDALAGVAICGCVLKLIGVPELGVFDLAAAVTGFLIVAAHRFNFGGLWGH